MSTPAPHQSGPEAKLEGIFPPPSITTTVLVTIAVYNVVELAIILFHNFRPLRGLFFWSFFSATWGIFFYVLGLCLQVYRISMEGLLIATFLVFGWIPMVTGEALVLYSRLHYLVRRSGIRKVVLVMIIVTGTAGHLPTVAMIYGAVSSRSLAWTLALLNYEKVQVSLFFFQSLTISGLYVFFAVRMLRTRHGALERASQQILRKFILLNFIYVSLGVSIVSLGWSVPSTVSAIYKATAYSVKLKLEYEVLIQLEQLPPPVAGFTSDDVEKHSNEDDGQTVAASAEPAESQKVIFQTFNGKTQIMDASDYTFPRTNSNFPAGEAYRSHLSDTVSVSSQGPRRSALQHWADNISEDDDIESCFNRSQKTNSEAGKGLSPSPGLKRVLLRH